MGLNARGTFCRVKRETNLYAVIFSGPGVEVGMG